MSGETKHERTYYHCRKNAKNHAHRTWYAAHPAHIFVREDLIIDPIAQFFAQRIFGQARKRLLGDTLPTARQDDQLVARRAVVQAELTDLQQRQNNLIRELERLQPSGDSDVDEAWRRSIQSRFAANAAEQRAKNRLLAEIAREERAQAPLNIDLIDALPITAVDITSLPEDQQRRLYDAFHFEVRYDLPNNAVILRATIEADTVPALAGAVAEVHAQHSPPTADRLGSGSSSRPAPHQDWWDASSAPGGIRTHTVGGLSSVPLPVGIRGPGRVGH